MRYRALIVEDNISLRELYGLYLERADFDHLKAASAKEAIHILQDHSVDLLLVDVNLGGSLSGLDLIEIVQGNPDYDHIKIMVITSFPKPYEDERSLRIDLLLNKPISFREMSISLTSMMEDKTT